MPPSVGDTGVEDDVGVRGELAGSHERPGVVRAELEVVVRDELDGRYPSGSKSIAQRPAGPAGERSSDLGGDDRALDDEFGEDGVEHVEERGIARAVGKVYPLGPGRDRQPGVGDDEEVGVPGL